MSRPKNSDSAKTYQALVDSAVEVLRQHGPKQVTLRRVSDHSGLSMGTITYYFATRIELVEACLDVHYDRVKLAIAEFHRDWSEAPADASILRRHVAHLVDIAFADRIFLQLRASSLGELHRYHSGRLNQHLLPALDLAVQDLAKALGVKSTDVRLAALTCNYAIARYAMLTDEELPLVVGAPTADAARAAIREHMCDVACRTLGLAT
ncbi:MAG: TetR/AcrR family transcriptional regulator [Polyangiaceae bacterium]